MFVSISRRLPTVGALVVALAVCLIAVADDPTTDIVIVCPDTVSAPLDISGYATEYTPACFVVAYGPGGVPIPGQTSNPFLSGRIGFAFPTYEPPAPYVVCITANDAAGQSGSKPVLVTN